MPAAVSAQELAPEHLALARQYVDLTDKANVYEVIAGPGRHRQPCARSWRRTPTSHDVVDAAITKILEAYKERKGELIDQFARVYAQRLHDGGAAGRSSTSTSRRSARSSPTSNADVNNDLQTVMKLFQINLRTEFFAKVRAELKAAGLNI